MTLRRVFWVYVLACAAFAVLGAIVVVPWFAAAIVVQASVQIIPAVLMARGYRRDLQR